MSPDPDDDYLLALATDADVDALISGDPDLNALSVGRLRIFTPRVLLDLADPDG